jgi:hypothetical protein
MTAAPDERIEANKGLGERLDELLRTHPRVYQVPVVGAAVGAAIGLIRGGRQTAWRFLAENAHRPPRTREGWYFYHKTKNYRVALGGVAEGAREGLRFGLITGAYVWLEEGLGMAGGVVGEGKEMVAGVVTMGVVTSACEKHILFCKDYWY